MRLEDLMERAAQYDETLARDIKDYVHGRKYGLVFEASKPEFVRMWKKPVVRGDLVNVLPPRGVMEDTKSDMDPHETVYKVTNIADGIATLINVENNTISSASVGDVVAIARFDRPIYAGLKEIGRIERGGNKPYHVVINGENYHALQTLLYAYQGKVDCIYIDPPYNSGAKDWKYNNNYVGPDDMYRHSKWLTFIEDRLKLAKKLLNPKSSVLIVTIDEKEYLRVGLLLEQLFPQARMQMISTVINPGGVTRTDEFSRTDEYLYILQFGDLAPQKLPLSSEWSMGQGKGMAAQGKIRWRELRRTGAHDTRTERPKSFFPIYLDLQERRIVDIGDYIPMDVNWHDLPVPEGCKMVLPLKPDGTEGCWRVSRDTMYGLLEKGYLRIGKDIGEYTTAMSFLAKGEQERVEQGLYPIVGRREDGSIITEAVAADTSFVPGTNWRIQSHDSTQYGTRLNRELLPDRKFPFPKSLYAVEDCLRFFTFKKKDALVVDFFAGSGTTAHAVMRLNHQDGGNRLCISVTNNEISEEESKVFTKKKLRQGDDEWEQLGIARYFTWPRITAAITGLTPSGEPIKGNYGVQVEEYQEVEGDVVDPGTDKKLRGKFYKKVRAQSKSVLDPFPMANGFEENAIFLELEYLEPSVVGADLAFDRIAPILWLCGGCEGEILSRHDNYVVGKTYAVLFDPTSTNEFVEKIESDEGVKAIFIVTDSAERYRSLCSRLPKRNVRQLYESYLRSFEINAIG